MLRLFFGETMRQVMSVADQPTAEDVRIQLERLLAGVPFKTSRRCQTLLRHIVERALAGESASLKERSLGVDAFERQSDYDTSEDPVVRVTAGEVRKKLAQYYQQPEHAGEPRIELNPGSYIPEFHFPDTAVTPPPPALAPAPPPRTRRKLLIAACATAAVAITAVCLLAFRWQRSDLERFWGPMLDAPGGVLFCLGQPRVYNLRSDREQRDLENRIEGPPGGSLESSQDSIPLQRLVPMWDRYVALGDATCLLRLTSLFEKRGRPYRIRGGASTSFSDLRERPAVLIGAFNNEWTLRALGRLRYTFYKDFRGLEGIRDRDHPERSDWKLVDAWPGWSISNDYAIVSRVVDRSTDKMVVIAAGITHFGTEGAGEFLSDPAHFAEAVPRLPPDWQARNLQIELPATGACSQHTSGKNNLGHVLCFPFVFIRVNSWPILFCLSR